MNIMLLRSKNKLAQIVYRLSSIKGHEDYRRFIVLSRSRTGSNLLMSLLNSHTNINCEGELFSALGGRSYTEILKNAFGRHPLYIKAKGFKIFYYHPQDDNFCNIWDDLASDQNLHIIHLKRENILHTLVSRKIASVRGVWSNTNEAPTKSSKKEHVITLNVEELREGFEKTRAWEESVKLRFKSQPILTVEYESLVKDRISVYCKMADFLGVSYEPPKTKLIKQNSRSMREIIQNYTELKSAFSNTEWSTFFDE